MLFTFPISGEEVGLLGLVEDKEVVGHQVCPRIRMSALVWCDFIRAKTILGEYRFPASFSLRFLRVNADKC